MASTLLSSTTTVRESYVDVLIIGAGPSGVMCANALNSAGISVRIVDKRPIGLTAGQADGIQPRTLEIMQSYGLKETLMKTGEPIWRAAFYDSDPNGDLARTTRVPALQAPNARWNYGVVLHQGGVEDIFVDAMQARGLEVERSTEPTSIELSSVAGDLNNAQAYTAKVVLDHFGRTDDRTEIVHAKFVLGSDGAHSWVRGKLDIKMEGDVTDSMWGVIDILPDTNFPDLRSHSIIHANAGTMIMLPRENDLNRLYIQLTETADLVDPKTGRVDKNRTSPQKLIEQGKKILRPYKIEIKNNQVIWWTVYVVGQRVAERYSTNNRAFIAGDACHTHSPKAGQGMNAGMGDSHNLAWKLVYVLRGWAKMSLLETYESERRTFAQTLINFDKVWSKLFTSKPLSADNASGVTREEFIGIFGKSSGFTSGYGIHYDPSAIVDTSNQALAPKLVIGERMLPQIFIRAADAHPVEVQDLLPADTRFKIMVFGGDVANKEDRARLQNLAEQFQSPGSFLNRNGGKNGDLQMFDMWCFSSGKQHNIDYLDFPEYFRPHWSRVLLDDCDVHGIEGGDGYTKYGIDKHGGAVVVVRPDGYVGVIAPLDRAAVLDGYFAAFLV